MAIVGAVLDEQTLMRAVALFGALGDRTRLLILRALATEDLRVNELVTRLGLAQATVSGHLAVLKYSGLVKAQVQAQHRLYSLAHPQLLDLLSAADRLLTRTRYAAYGLASSADCRDST